MTRDRQPIIDAPPQYRDSRLWRRQDAFSAQTSKLSNPRDVHVWTGQMFQPQSAVSCSCCELDERLVVVYVGGLEILSALLTCHAGALSSPNVPI